MSEADIISPCIKLCAVDGKSGLCLGCGRTLKEIGAWSGLTHAERLQIMDELQSRLSKLSPSA